MATNPKGETYSEYTTYTWDLASQLPGWTAPAQSSKDNTHALLNFQALKLERARNATQSYIYDYYVGSADLTQARLAWVSTDRLIANSETLVVEVWDYSTGATVPVTTKWDTLDFLTLPERMCTTDGESIYYRNLAMCQATFYSGAIATLQTLGLVNAFAGIGSASIVAGEPVYWSEDNFATYTTITPGSTDIDYTYGLVSLTNAITSSTITIRYTSKDVYDHWDKLVYVSVNGTEKVPNRYDLWTTFDSWGALVGCFRYTEEDNVSYRDRLLSVFRAPGNSTPDGMKLGLARDLGVLHSTIWTVSSIVTQLVFGETPTVVLVHHPEYGIMEKNNTIDEELQPGYARQYWYPSRTPVRGGIEEIYVDQRRTASTLITVNGAAAVSLGTYELVTARYTYKVWEQSGTTIYNRALEPASYVVYYATGVTVSLIQNSTYQTSQLLDTRSVPNANFRYLVDEIKRRIPVTWGSLKWGEPYFYMDTEAQPKIGFMPSQLDSNLAYS